MTCNRCGAEYPNVLPSPYALMTLSGPYGGKTWVFCVDKCAPVIEAWLDHTWEPGQDAVQVAIDANGALSN